MQKSEVRTGFLSRVAQALRNDAKLPRQESILDQTGDVINETIRKVVVILGILVISAMLAAFMPYVLGTPNGPADLIAIIYAQTCAESGVCDIPTLNTGFAIAVILFAGFTMSLFAAFRSDPHEAIREDIETLSDTLDRIEANTIPDDELPARFRVFEDDAELDARLRMAAND